MSDNTDTTDDMGDGSLFSNFKNKFKYKIHKAAYDPNANKFASEQAKKKKEEEEAKKKDKSDTTATDTKEANETKPSDPDKFSVRRLAKKVGNQTLDILKKIFFPFVGLMLAMIVANELIIYAPPIRIIFFIFTLAICIYSHTIAILLGVYYILKGGYSFYVNNMTDKPNKNLMPTIFALLPITTFKPMSSFVGFFLYPFTYPKTEAGAQALPDIMKNYWESLVGSFKDFDKVKNLPIFVEDVKSIKYNLAHLHDLSNQVLNLKNNTASAAPVNNNVAVAPVKNNSEKVTNNAEKITNNSEKVTNNSGQINSNTEKTNNVSPASNDNNNNPK